MAIHLNSFTQCSPCPQSKGQWKHPDDHSVPGYRELDHWIERARTVERGCFDAFFFADVHGTYDVYRDSRRDGIRHGVQIPCNDPTLLIPAMAAETRHLGFASTYSTAYFAPYLTAKHFSTLDHLTNGRVGWNVVTSYLRDASRQGLPPSLPHDERYERADEYMEVVYRLWEESWDDGAIVYDTAGDRLIDPDKVHEINHVGKYFEVEGPHLCEPSPQRTPVLYQAGSSERGIAFGARHGEALFTVFPNREVARSYTDRYRDAIRAEGRSPGSAKLLMGIAVVAARSDALARELWSGIRDARSPEGALALFGGWTGIDLSQFRPEDEIRASERDGMQFFSDYFQSVDPNKKWTFAEVAEYLSVGSVVPVVVGGPSQVADELERWIEQSGIDGFNVLCPVEPLGTENFVNYVVPELQRRNLFRTSYEASTLREHYFGVGNALLAKDHPGARWREARNERARAPRAS
jgi:FMN-dependent oxidoreductase (nitrilotriacetate monooxygenase family)